MYHAHHNPNYAEARENALRLLDEYDIREPLIPVFEIAQRQGLKTVLFKPEGELAKISGLLDPETKTIYINEQDPRYRQNFTVAHELGHYLLGHRAEDLGMLYRFATPIDKDPVEQEANCFAAHLLIPPKMLDETLKQYPSLDGDVKRLAPLFGVSYGVVKYRLKCPKN